MYIFSTAPREMETVDVDENMLIMPKAATVGLFGSMRSICLVRSPLTAWISLFAVVYVIISLLCFQALTLFASDVTGPNAISLLRKNWTDNAPIVARNLQEEVAAASPSQSLTESERLMQAAEILSAKEIAQARGEQAEVEREWRLEYSTSPYERRTGFKLPQWAQKYPESFYGQKQVSDGEGICLVHVGKTAGSTVACYVGFQYACGGDKPEETIPAAPQNMVRLTTRVFHNDILDCSPDMSFYLFTVRHPVKRMQSWFRYEYPYYLQRLHDEGHDLSKLDLKGDMLTQKNFFYDCGFDSLRTLAEQGLSRIGNATDDCQQLALQAVLGLTPLIRHNYYNYHHYYSKIQKLHANATYLPRIAVLRTEHLTKDWNSMEDILQGVPGVVQDIGITEINYSRDENVKYGLNNSLTDTALTLLCAGLCLEIQVYKKILKEAVNLLPEQVEESMQELRYSCPKETDVNAEADCHIEVEDGTSITDDQIAPAL